MAIGRDILNTGFCSLSKKQELQAQLSAYEVIEVKIRNRVSRLTTKVAAALGKRLPMEAPVQPCGKKVFIGHGGSPAWKDLREFLKAAHGGFGGNPKGA